MPDHKLPAVAPITERRRRPDGRLGRRSSDVWFPYSPAFVVQVLAQTGETPRLHRAAAEGIRAYAGGPAIPQPAENRGERAGMVAPRRI